MRNFRRDFPLEILNFSITMSKFANGMQITRLLFHFNRLALIAIIKTCFFSGIFSPEILSSYVDDDEITLIDRSSQSAAHDLANTPSDKLWSVLKDEPGLRKIQKHLESGGDANLVDSKGRGPVANCKKKKNWV